MSVKRTRKWTEYQYPFAFRQAVISEIHNVLKAPDVINENYRVIRVPRLHERITAIQQFETSEYCKRQRKILFCVFLTFLMSSVILFSTTKKSQLLAEKVSIIAVKVVNNVKGDFNKAVAGVSTIRESNRF